MIMIVIHVIRSLSISRHLKGVARSRIPNVSVILSGPVADSPARDTLSATRGAD